MGTVEIEAIAAVLDRGFLELLEREVRRARRKVEEKGLNGISWWGEVREEMEGREENSIEHLAFYKGVQGNRERQTPSPKLAKHS